MKFGQNLAYLSIPEWKDYNLDYNELKRHIREATQSKKAGLKGLRRLFLKNLECVDLFIVTKSEELTCKLRSDATELLRLKASTQSVVVKLERLDALQYKFINEVSIELRKLNKFILVQKIAVKKIFKKFVKYYPDENVSRQFVTSFTNSLYTDPSSFMNFDSSGLTSSLSDLLIDVDSESKYLHESLHQKPLALNYGDIKKTASASSLGSLRTSLFSTQPSPEDTTWDVNFDLDISQTARFDIVAALKKNFFIHSLLPRDLASRNDVYLSIDIYLNIPKFSETVKTSVVYLTSDSHDECPSWIVSYEDSPTSTVIAYTGGLRKYSYCCLPNSIVNNVFSFLNRKGRDYHGAKYSSNITTYLQDDILSPMTKVAVSSLLESDAVPSLRLVMDRTRYFLNKGGKPMGKSVTNPTDRLSASPLSTDYQSAAHSVEDNKVYEDSFYMMLDEQIYTSCKVLDEVSFDVSNMDAFPFNSFGIFSNDSNLHNFESSLTSEINGNLLQNKYREIMLKKLPIKIQSFLKTTSAQLFKDFRIFDYMRSCYFNVVPMEPNNHYSRLLNINLLKKYENVEAINNQHDMDGSIIKGKSRIILNRQISYKSIREYESTKSGESTPLRHVHSVTSCVPYSHMYDDHHIKAIDLEDQKDLDDINYISYVNLSNDLEKNFLNNVVVSFIRFKYRTNRLLRFFEPQSSDKHESMPRHHKSLYDSINDTPAFLNSYYQEKFIQDYDYVLSHLYFSLCFSSIFISGINIGILYSLFDMVDDDVAFQFLDNFLLIVLLTFGFLFSLAFTMIGISLNFQRFESSPPLHSGIIWTGFLLVLSTIAWALFCILP